MASKNVHTGDKQQTKATTEDFRKNYDAIFRKVPKEEVGKLVKENPQLDS